MSAQGGGQTWKALPSLEWCSISMNHHDVMWRDAFWETLTCSPPLPDGVQARTQDKEDRAAEKQPDG